MIELRNLCRRYVMGDNVVDALKNINLKIAAGEFVAIMGRSGSGKSTLLHILGLLDNPSSGSYRLFGKEVANLGEDELAIYRRNTLGFIFQQFHLLPRLSAAENVAMPLLYSGSAPRAPAQLLKQVGLQNRMQHRPAELSGGQQQRVAIARALVNNPKILLADEPTGNLDTASQHEILELLSTLHESGIGIVVVTHDEEVAARAHRIIRMQDGEIIQDKENQEYSKAKVVFRTATSPPYSAVGLSATNKAPYRSNYWIALLREGYRAVVANKLRSALSMLGIMIGVASVIAMLALGSGAQKSIETQLASLGANVLVVRPGTFRFGGVAQESGSPARLAVEDVDWLKNRIAEIKAIAGNVTGRAQVVYNNKNWSTTVQGAGIEYATIRNATPFIGRMFTKAEAQSRARVALLGLSVVRELYGEENPIGTFIKINKVNFQVIGVMPAKGGTGFRDQDDVVVIPLSTAMYRLLGKQYLDSLDVEVHDGMNIDDVGESIKRALYQRHRIPISMQDDGYQVMNLSDIRAAVAATSATMSVLLASIAAVSLFVGGIGIMNIMLVSVTERTKEIGLRKAVGARRRDILWQFLFETLAISLSGGASGMLLGAAASMLLSSLAGWATAVSGFSVFLAVFFSVAVGLVFGIYPARKAALLNPIEALRHE